MFEVGDFVKIHNSDLFGVVVGFAGVFNMAQHLDDMVIVSITNSTDTKLFKKDSLEKVLVE